MKTIKFISSSGIAFFLSAVLGAVALRIDWPWDGEGVLGFLFTLLLFTFGVFPIVVIQRHKLGLSNKPWLMGILFGLAGYPFVYGIFTVLAELLRPLQLGQWFWPIGLICLSIVTIAVICWFAIEAISTRLSKKH